MIPANPEHIVREERDNREVKTSHLVQLLAEGEADIQAGRTQPYDEFIKEFRRAKKISD